jgi:hypothetical protein
MESWVAPPLLLIAALAWLGPAPASAREATPGAARAARIEPVPLPRPRPASAPVLARPLGPGAVAEPPVLADVPLPRPRPGTEPAAPDPAVMERYAACLDRLAAVAELTPEAPAVGNPACEAHDLVRFTALRLAGGERVALQPAATIRCALAEAIVGWVREDVAAAARVRGTRPASLTVDTSYECRPRNRIAGAKMSEHGRGNAVDLRAVTLADGRVVGLTDPAADKAFRTAVAQASCARFTTVLGPGSDGYHESHIHLDIAERRGGYRLCQWEVREPVKPPPARPDAKPPDAKPPDAKPPGETRDPPDAETPEGAAATPDAASPDAAAEPEAAPPPAKATPKRPADKPSKDRKSADKTSDGKKSDGKAAAGKAARGKPAAAPPPSAPEPDEAEEPLPAPVAPSADQP